MTVADVQELDMTLGDVLWSCPLALAIALLCWVVRRLRKAVCTDKQTNEYRTILYLLDASYKIHS